jgi:hypothetical protein
MTCCIIAMLIIAHVMATLRRWGVFWGVVRPVEGEDDETIFRRLRQWFGRPRVRMAVMALVAVEAVSVGSWLYLAHGTHIRQLGDQAIGSLKGQTIVYAEVCGPGGANRTVRVVIARNGAGMAETTL